MVSSGVIIVISVVLTFLVSWWRGRRERRMLALIPNLPGVPLAGNLFSVLNLPRKDLLPLGHRWAQEYGPVFKTHILGVKRVILSGPKEISVLLNCKENLSKDLHYGLLKPWLGTGLLTGSGDKWRTRRRLLTPAFHYKILEDFIHVFNANSAILVAKLRQHTAERYVEINEPVALCALDIICETTMGTSIHAQKDEGVEYVTAVHRMCEVFFKRVMSPWLYPDFLFGLSALGREQQRVVKVLQDFSGRVIKKKRSEFQERKANPNLEDNVRRKSFLDILLEISDTDGSWSDEDIREEVNTFMFAGHDTTAAAISWALFLLGSDQQVQDKVVVELSGIFGSDQREPTAADLHNMTYLGQVIKEALRLYPSVPFVSRILSKDTTFGDFTIPAGTNVGAFIYSVHRNPDIYPDSERFAPERFSPEEIKNRHPFAHIPFSAGPRNCIGQKFARLEEKCVISAVLRNFSILSLDSRQIVLPYSDAVLKPDKKIRIKISNRK